MIEYALIAVLVILGIVIMGPYALRSVNAHFKLWDEGVQDSFRENVNQEAPLADIPAINTNCTCTLTKGSCGSTTSACGSAEREWDYNCNPQGCNKATGASTCIYDTSCCTTYFPQFCGTVPCPAGGCATAPTTPPVANNCYYGQDVWATQCSTLSIECKPNAICQPQCRGVLSPGALPCPNQPQSAADGLLQDYGISYAASKASCNTPCQVYCDNAHSYFLNASGTACTRDFNVAPDSGTCPAGCTCPSSGWPYVLTVYTCSFQYCAPDPTTAILSVTTAADPTGQSTTTPIKVAGDGCQNPGEPKNQCQISVTYR